jgi:hypothetical protein
MNQIYDQVHAIASAPCLHVKQYLCIYVEAYSSQHNTTDGYLHMKVGL